MCAMISIWAKNGAEILDRIRSLLSKDPASVAAREIIDRLYGILTTLDAKANGLLRVNSLFLAILVFFLGWARSPTGFPTFLTMYVDAAYVDTFLLVLSSLLCLWIVKVSWAF